MAEYAFETVDVFTATRFGGNPLAVLTDARGLDDAAMQRIAAEFNLSETSFVFPPVDPAHTALVRIFTPKTELPFAGHPNVGTALVLAAHLAARPERMVFEGGAGLVPVAFDWPGDAPRATIGAPKPLEIGVAIPAETIAACTGIDVDDVLTTRHAPVAAGMGTVFVIAEVRFEALARASPDTAAMREAAGRYAVRPLGFPVLLHAAAGAGRRARMFSPLSGTAEDPATGSANVTLAGLLLEKGGGESLTVDIEQGVEMGRPSQLHAGARRGADGIRGWVGGSAVAVMRGTIAV